MNGDQGQLSTDAQSGNITGQSAHSTRSYSPGREESPEKGNQQQEVRTSCRLRKQPGKMYTFLWSTR